MCTTTGFPSSAASSSCALEELALRVRAARSRGRSRGRSRRPRRRARRRAARAARRAWPHRDQPPDAGGSRAPRKPPRGARRSSSVSRQESSPEPTETMRSTPASRARATSSSGRRPRTRRGARACRSRRGGRLLDPREERRRGRDPFGRRRPAVRDPLEGEVDRLAERGQDLAAPSAAGTATARRRPRASRPRGRRARRRARAARASSFASCQGAVCLDVAVEPADELPDRPRARRSGPSCRSARRASPAGRRARPAAPRSVVRARSRPSR